MPATPHADPIELLYAPEHLEHLRKLGDQAAEGYRNARPFPHAVIDDFLPVPVLERVLESFPTPGDLDWQRFSNPSERKLAFRTAEFLAPPVRDLLHFLNSAPVMDFLERLTGIDGLIPDPYFDGGGLHQIEPGGLLGIHADFNRLPKLRLDRRLNLLLFLNVDWKQEYGGHLELWERDMSACVERVLPVFNRCVVFSTTSDSFHGHPDPLTCPEGRTRKSLATYYYSNGRPEEEVRADHTTLFRARPGSGDRAFDRERLRQVVRAVLPPVVFDLLRGLRRRGR